MLKGNGSEHISLLSLAIMTGYGSNQKYFWQKGLECGATTTLKIQTTLYFALNSISCPPELSGMKHLKIFLDTTPDKTVEIVPSIC